MFIQVTDCGVNTNKIQIAGEYGYNKVMVAKAKKVGGILAAISAGYGYVILLKGENNKTWALTLNADCIRKHLVEVDISDGYKVNKDSIEFKDKTIIARYGDLFKIINKE